MDDPSHSLDQEKEGDQQASALPILIHGGNLPEGSDNIPPLAETKAHLAIIPFQPVLEVLADLERDGHKFVFLAARLVGLYRRLWESCVSKHIGGEKLEQSNRNLKEDGTRLKNERDSLQRHHDKQLVQLRFFEQALESSRERLVSLLDDWNYPSRPNLVELPDVARAERETVCFELP
ncbi:unnamed protein product [Penicillium viridicatum]